MVRRKRPEERTGHPHGPLAESGPVSRAPSKRKDITSIPVANDRWLPQSRSWYNSLALSGQSAFYEASDWATAVCAAESYDLFLRTRNSSILAQFVRLSERLGATLVDRSRSRMELTDTGVADGDEEAADAAVIDWHSRLHRHGLAPVPDPVPPEGGPPAA